MRDYKENIYKVLCFLFLAILLIAKTEVVVAQADRQQKKYQTYISSDKIKSMRTFIDGNELSYPAIELNGDNKIVFEFDLLEDNAKDYLYQIIHCSHDWMQSDLFSEEFMDGYNENYITDYKFSANTKISYVHYRQLLPNDDVQLKVSGNYVIRLFEEGNKEETVALSCFSVYEPLLNVQADITQPTKADKTSSGQEISFSVFHENLEIVDPFSEIKINIRQNNRPDRVIKDLQPAFVRNNELVYSFAGDNIIDAGNEFRNFNTRSLKLFGGHINDIKFVDSVYHFQLRLDERRSYKKYFSQEDLNGKYIIYSSGNYNNDIVADYVYVYFNLKYEQPLLDAKLYVFGGFNNWALTEENKMYYNFETSMYENVILLKQGLYNYSYAFVNNYIQEVDETVVEGSHYETENDYLLFVYYNGIDENYDRLVGYQIVNSRFR